METDGLREYQLTVRLNERLFRRVLVSTHYEVRHKEHMNDALILKLLSSINGEIFPIQALRPDGHKIIVVDPLHYLGNSYRLVATIHDNGNYLGVINAFRRRLK